MASSRLERGAGVACEKVTRNGNVVPVPVTVTLPASFFPSLGGSKMSIIHNPLFHPDAGEYVDLTQLRARNAARDLIRQQGKESAIASLEGDIARRPEE